MPEKRGQQAKARGKEKRKKRQWTEGQSTTVCEEGVWNSKVRALLAVAPFITGMHCIHRDTHLVLTYQRGTV